MFRRPWYWKLGMKWVGGEVADGKGQSAWRLITSFTARSPVGDEDEQQSLHYYGIMMLKLQ
jgi:hypothetical protein